MKKNNFFNIIILSLTIVLSCFIIVSCSLNNTVEEDPSLIQSLMDMENQIKKDIDKIKEYDITDIQDRYDDGKNQTETNSTTAHLNESYVQIDKQYTYTVPSTAQSLEYVDESESKMNIQYYERSKDYRDDPEYAYLSYIDEYETPRGKIGYVMLSKKRKGSKVNQFDHYIRYFYNDKDELVKLNQDYILPYLGKNEHIIQIDETGYIIAVEAQEGSFYYKYYTKDGNNYRTELANGNSLTTVSTTVNYNGKQYITNLNGNPLKQYILIPEGSDYDKTIESFYKGEKVTFVNPKDIEDEFTLTRNNRQQAKLIDENVKDDSYAKELYLRAKSYSTTINSSNPDVINLNELVGLDGYVDDLPKNYQGQVESMSDYNSFTGNPVNKRGFVELVETDYVFMRDYAKVIHIMDKDKAEEYTEEIFKEIREYINSSDSIKQEAKKRINKYRNVKVIQAGKQVMSQINNKTKKYIKELQKLYDDKWPKKEE